MTGSERFWYSLVQMDVGTRLKSREFGIVVAREPVDRVVERFKRDEKEKARFQKIFDERMKAFVRDVGLGEKGDVRYDLYEGEEPWLHGFNLGHGSVTAALYLNRDKYDPALMDRDRERVYRSHNCDNLEQRGILITGFGIWAEMVEAFAG